MICILFFAIILGSLAGCERNPQSIGGGYDLRNRTVYVVNGLSETLTAIDVEEGVVYNNIVELGKWPNYITSNPDGTLLYVVNSGDNHVMEIDVDGGNSSRSIDIGIGRNPWQCEVSGPELWTSNFLTGEISISDIPSGGGTQYMEVGVTLQALVVSGDFVYVTDTNYRYGSFGPGRVIVVGRAGRNEVGSCQVGINPQDLLVDDSGELDILCTGSYESGNEGEIHRVDPLALVPRDTLSVGGSPSSMCPGEGYIVYVAGYWGGVMSYDAREFKMLNGPSDPILSGDGFTDVLYDPVVGLLYVSRFDEDDVLSLDPLTHQIISRYSVGDGPVRMLMVPP